MDMRMAKRHCCVLTGLLGLLAICSAARAAGIESCPIDGNCAEVAVEGPSRPAQPGDTVLVRVVFQQGADDQQPGGIDDIAALTATVGLPGLALADCSPPGGDGLNPSFVVLPGDAGRYRVVVQNLTCAKRASCLCPTGDEPRDEYVNLLIVGTPGAAAVQSLPNGELLGVALRVPPDAGSQVPLHIFSALDGSTPARPPGGAALSIADGTATDRTVDAASERMNVRVADGELAIATAPATPVATNTAGATATATLTEPPTPTATETATATRTPAPPTASATATATTTAAVSCIGDCDHSGEITVAEVITGVSIALGSLPSSSCPAFACAHGGVDVSCLVAGVNAALNGCPAQ
jgi:hypothetical protein